MFIYNEHKFLYTSNTSQNVNKWNRCCVVVRGLRGTELLIAQTLICLQLFTFTRNYQIILWTSYVFGVKRQRSFENFVPLLKNYLCEFIPWVPKIRLQQRSKPSQYSPKKKSSCCKISAEMCQPNRMPCSMAMRSSFQLYQSVSIGFEFLKVLSDVMCDSWKNANF